MKRKWKEILNNDLAVLPSHDKYAFISYKNLLQWLIGIFHDIIKTKSNEQWSLLFEGVLSWSQNVPFNIYHQVLCNKLMIKKKDEVYKWGLGKMARF